MHSFYLCRNKITADSYSNYQMHRSNFKISYQSHHPCLNPHDCSQTNQSSRTLIADCFRTKRVLRCQEFEKSCIYRNPWEHYPLSYHSPRCHLTSWSHYINYCNNVLVEYRVHFSCGV